MCTWREKQKLEEAFVMTNSDNWRRKMSQLEKETSTHSRVLASGTQDNAPIKPAEETIQGHMDQNMRKQPTETLEYPINWV